MADSGFPVPTDTDAESINKRHEVGLDAAYKIALSSSLDIEAKLHGSHLDSDVKLHKQQGFI